MLRKRAVWAILIIAMISITYIFAIDQYDSMAHEIEWMREKIELEKVYYNEVGIEVKGIKYNEPLTLVQMADKEEEMIEGLSHESSCSKFCQLQHKNEAKKMVQAEEDILSAEISEKGLDYKYDFTMKNQKDIHENTYYDLIIKGSSNMQKMDQLRNWGTLVLSRWGVETKETVYFKGKLEGELTEADREALKKKVFSELEAADTDSYQDDLNGTTCAYYGYTSHIEAYIEENEQRTNVQMSFKYDEITGETELIVAFPFYNEPF